MSKKDGKRRRDFVVDANLFLGWSYTTESKSGHVRWRSEDVEAFLDKYKENSDINYWVVEAPPGTGKSWGMWKVAENLTQQTGRTPRDMKPAKVISNAPGSWVLRMSEFLCTKNLYERVFLQSILNMREEYFDALAKGRKEKAQWVKVRGYIALILTVTRHVIVSVFSGPAEILKSLWG